MPTIPTAITINTTVVSPETTLSSWALGCLVGLSSATTKNTPKKYASLSAIQSEHGSTSQLSKSAASAFDQGIKELYLVSIAAASSIPTVAELTTALDTLTPLVEANIIRIVALAGIYSDKTTLTTELRRWSDANNVIFCVTNPIGTTVSQITDAAAALASSRGYFLAHATPTGSTMDADIGAAALACLSVLNPGESPMWMPVTVPIASYFSLDDQDTLEAVGVNFVCTLLSQEDNRISCSYNLAASNADEPARYIDSVIGTMYVALRIQTRLARYRMGTRKIPYTQVGLEYIRAELVAELAELTGPTQVLQEATVTMPTWTDIPADDIRDRILRNIIITGTQTGNMHKFVVNMTLEVI